MADIGDSARSLHILLTTSTLMASIMALSCQKVHVDILTGNPDIPQSGAGLQPTCRTCCHTLAPKYYLNSIHDMDKQKFYTNYLTKSQDENSYAGRSIGPAIPNHNIFAGYNVVPRIMGRMFLPIFGVKGKWYPVCALANIPQKDHHWCTNDYAHRVLDV